jgi:hypothetical protein
VTETVKSGIQCVIPALLLRQAEALCQPRGEYGPTRDDYLSFLIILEAAVIADEFLIFDVRQGTSSKGWEGALAEALRSVITVKICQWKSEENEMAQAFAMGDDRPGPYSAFFQQTDGDFLIAGGAICPKWAIEKFANSISDSQKEALAVAFENTGLNEDLKILMPAEMERFKKQYLAQIRLELETADTVKKYFGATACALPPLWAPIWNWQRNEARIPGINSPPPPLERVDFSPLAVCILKEISPHQSLPGKVLKMRQDYANLRRLISEFIESCLSAATDHDFRKATESAALRWRRLLPQAEQLKQDQWNATGGIVLQPRSIIGVDWNGLSPAGGLIIAHGIVR